MGHALTYRLTVIVLAGLIAGGCGRRADSAGQAAKQVVVWRALGSWSGRGNRQTESFTSETGALRVRWETSREAPPGTGTFRLTAHSAISGRPLGEVVDSRGVGSGEGYVIQDPHIFYVVIDSTGLDWKFSVEEGIAGRVTGKSRR